MGSHDSPQAVLLDVGGTLIEARPAVPDVYARTLSRWGRPVEAWQVAPVFQEVWTELTQLHPLGLDRYHHLKGGEWEWWGEFLRRVLARLGHPAPWEPVLKELFTAFAEPSLWRVFPEVQGVLGKLRSSGLRLAVVSNWDSRLPRLLEGLGLSGFFNEVLVSSVEGVEKPGAEIFRRAASRLGVAVEACLHAGDSPLDDYRGAESAGMRAVLVDRAGIFNNGYLKVADLRELYDLVT
ncbi:MAG TPA: HAD-IA family hydrolase [Thermoanaerobaculaceae bacterium]|nr:HAD-IA family hydrolase [Thermoanaerobaculaceae bacterium]